MKKILFYIILVILFSWLIHSPPEETYHKETYIVQEGDTAWSIMSRYNTANKDIRKLIHYLEEDNDIKAGYLQIGQELKIRIYEKE